MNIIHSFAFYQSNIFFLFISRSPVSYPLPSLSCLSPYSFLCLPLEINFTLHYQSESLQTQTHWRNHTNRLHTQFQWAFPPGPTYFNQYKHVHVCVRTHIHAISPFVLTLLYFHKTRKVNESSWCKCHEASRYGLLRWEEWVALTHSYKHTHTLRTWQNENELQWKTWRPLAVT